MKKFFFSIMATVLFSGFALANEKTIESVTKNYNENTKLCRITIVTRDFWTGEITSVVVYDHYVQTAAQCESLRLHYLQTAG